MEDELILLHCRTCSQNQTVTKSLRIEGAPEDLRIKINIVDVAARERNNNPIRLTRDLDLTNF